MLVDQVKDLEEMKMDIGTWVHNLEQVIKSLMTQQDKLNNKVNILSFDWNLNCQGCTA